MGKSSFYNDCHRCGTSLHDVMPFLAKTVSTVYNAVYGAFNTVLKEAGVT